MRSGLSTLRGFRLWSSVLLLWAEGTEEPGSREEMGKTGTGHIPRGPKGGVLSLPSNCL